MIKAKLSNLVKNQFPDFYKEDGDNFLAFIEGYYEYLEQNGKLTDAIQNIQDYKSIDTTLDEYIDYFQNTLLPSVPHNVVSDKRLLAKYVKYFNISRGTLSSYKLLFRSIYNEDIEVNYPADQMLKVSDGDWRLDQYLVAAFDKKVFGLIGKIIVGETSTAEALVEDVVGRVVRNRDVLQIILSNVRGEFQNLEPITLKNTDGSGDSFNVEAGISSLDLVTFGGEYKRGDVVDVISDDTGSLGKVVISDTIDLLGSISFILSDGGSGYTSSIYGEDQGESQIRISGGDGEVQPSFTLNQPDISDSFAIAFNTNLIASNNIFGELAPLIHEGNPVRKMDTFANTILSSPQFGFPEQNQVMGNLPFLTSSNSLITVANSNIIHVGDTVTGSATGADGYVQQIVDGTAGATILRIDTYKNFTDRVHNYFSFSEEINTNSHWLLSRSSTPLDNHLNAPDGTLTSENLIESTQVGNGTGHYCGVKSTAVLPNQWISYWNFSVYAKAVSAGSKRWLGFRGLGNGGNNKYPVFDVAEGVIADAGDGTWSNVKIQPAGNGWYRCSGSSQPAFNSSAGLRIQLLAVGNNDGSESYDYTGDGVSGLAIWGAQQTLGHDLKPYHRTTTTETVNSGEYLHIGKTTAGANVGKVTAYSANNVGSHVLQIGVFANTNTISVGDELVSKTISTHSDDYVYGVVTQILDTQSNAYNPTGADTRDLMTVKVSSNTSSGLTNQFDTSGLSAFLIGQDLRKVGSTVSVAIVADSTSNTTCEHVYTKLEDSLLFKTATFGTIENLSNRVSGSGFTVAPKVQVIEPNISALGIGEQYVTLQTDTANWGTGNTSVTVLDTNDRIVQTNGISGTASGDIKMGASPNKVPATIQHANGTYETTVRVWQDFLQRDPNNIFFRVGGTVSIEKYEGEYVPGGLDTRTLRDSGSAKITEIQDEGVLGKNAQINTSVGANGTVSKLKIIDSGYSYRDKELVRIQESGRPNSLQATARLSLKGTANSQGYYGTSRSHVSTSRGYIQDSNFYQEYSYQLIAPISLDRYKEVALKLVHPAGQTLFGRYQAHSNVSVNVSTSANNLVTELANGTVSLSNTAPTQLVGTSTEFTKHFSNGDLIIIKTSPENYVKLKLNIVSSDTSATLNTQWNSAAVAAAEVYYTKGTIS